MKNCRYRSRLWMMRDIYSTSKGARKFSCFAFAAVALGLAFVLARSTIDAPRLDLTSWAELEKALRETDATRSAPETMEQCDQFAAILESGDAGVYEEMATQIRYPLVNLAGFYAMQKRFPTKAWRTALTILVRSEHPASELNVPMLLEVNKQREPVAFQKMLDWLVALPVAQADGLSVVMVALDGEALYRWYHTPPTDVGSASMEAAILDRLTEVCQKLEREPSEMMRTRLRAVGAVPGRPRLIYVMDAGIMGAQSYDPEFVRALISVMEDPDLKSISISFVCHKHFDYIESNIDLERLVVDDERKQVIKEALETTRRLRQSSSPATSDR